MVGSATDRTVFSSKVTYAADWDIDGITLSWSVAAETDTTSYKIYRRSEID